MQSAPADLDGLIGVSTCHCYYHCPERTNTVNRESGQASPSAMFRDIPSSHNCNHAFSLAHITKQYFTNGFIGEASMLLSQ